jgi:Ca2+-binding RTX toxin-like protein
LTSIQSVYGSDFNDSLTGSASNDLFYPGAGNDVVNGGSGGFDEVSYADAPSAETVNLGAGTAIGGGGVDTLTSIHGVYGSEFDDSLTGSASPDEFWGLGGADSIIGAGGFDFADYDHAAGAVTVNLSTGVVSGADGADHLSQISGVIGTDFADTLTGNAAANSFYGLFGDDTITGGAGSDFVHYDFRLLTSGVQVNLATGTVTGGEGNDHLSQIESVFGSTAGDSLTGSSAGNTLIGFDGADTINAVDGISGNDTVNGGDGTDNCSADAGDTITNCE